MRRTVRLVFALVLPATTAASAPQPSELGASQPHRVKMQRLEPEPAPILAAPGPPRPGEDVPNALRIGALPFRDAATSCGFRDNHTPDCTFLGGAPDVVYSFTPVEDVCVTADLCSSSYDTALLVLAGMPEAPLACNDDACERGSRLENLLLAGGRTYFFVIDGWNGACGEYVFDLRECPPPCPLPEPVAALDEGEPVCADGYYDRYNSGCNEWPYTFSELPCAGTEVAVRGTYGTWRYYDEDFRDTDWYEIQLTRPTQLECRVQGGAATQMAILDGRRGCGEWDVLCGPVLGEACEALTCQAVVEPGTYWLFVAPRRYQGVLCGTRYVLTLNGMACATIGARPDPWSLVKARYR
jgi:hypothetical protein